MTMTPERRARLTAIGKIGGLTFSATHDTKVFSTQGRKAFRESFSRGHGCDACETVTFPDDLDAREKQRRADALYRLHFANLARRRRT